MTHSPAPSRGTSPAAFRDTSASPPRLADQSVADLVRLASTQISELVRDEMRLARAEMATKSRYAGTGAGMLGAAAILAAYGGASLLYAAGLLLAKVVPAWLAALIVAVAVLSIAAILALVGRSSLKRAVPPVPAEAAASLRADLAEVSDALSRGGKNEDRVRSTSGGK